MDSLPNATALRLGDHRLVNQAGDTVSLNNDLKGKILVVNFFFTTCPTICPRLSSSIAMLQKVYRKNDSTFQFVSVSVDPVRDSVLALRNYADRYKANWDRWWFMTGDKRDIYNMARNELRLTAEPGDGGADDFIHSEQIVLIDRDRYIRGYYNGLDSFDVKRCADDMALLMISKDKTKKKK
jgi:protein SCO1/2